MGMLEGTGLYGKSELLRLDTEGQIVARQKLEPRFFGEGITSLNGTVYQLTWREGTIFVYNQNLDGTSFLPPLQIRGVINNFQKQEGWGLTNNGEHLIASDGSNNFCVGSSYI